MDVVAEYRAAVDAKEALVRGAFGDLPERILTLYQAANKSHLGVTFKADDGLVEMLVSLTGTHSYVVVCDDDQSAVNLKPNFMFSSFSPDMRRFDGILSDPAKQDAFLRLLISELAR